MGTNFYLTHHAFVDGEYKLDRPCECCGRKDAVDDMSPVVHVGKRSAAGLYCWDCRMTFCKEGEERVHHSGTFWYDFCPSCGKEYEQNHDLLKQGAAAIELGFATTEEQVPTGVGTVCSFSWAQPPDKFREFVETRADQIIVKDEYGRELTGQQFLTMLACNCPVELTHFVGDHFC